MTPVRLEPVAPRSRVKHSTTEPLRSLFFFFLLVHHNQINDINFVFVTHNLVFTLFLHLCLIIGSVFSFST